MPSPGPTYCTVVIHADNVRTVIVTGGASGIGEAYSRALVNAGAYVVIADIDENAGKKLQEGLSGPSNFVKCDVSSCGQSTRTRGASCLGTKACKSWFSHIRPICGRRLSSRISKETSIKVNRPVMLQQNSNRLERIIGRHEHLSWSQHTMYSVS